MYTASGWKQIQIKSYDYHDRTIRWSWCWSAGYLGCASSRAETAGRRGQSRFRGRSRFRRSISFGAGSSGFGERHLENKIIFNFISYLIINYPNYSFDKSQRPHDIYFNVTTFKKPSPKLSNEAEIISTAFRPQSNLILFYRNIS